ncbi:MAG: hypothetical protein IBJ15_00945 [Alphaproteobacteria bacterium]|nr:hypothetical protein [Alphaproteobacteria bacterium]
MKGEMHTSASETAKLRADCATLAVEICAALFRVRPNDVYAPRRAAAPLKARFAAAVLMRSHFDIGLSALGRLIGGRDHATIVNAINRAAELVEADSAFRVLLAEAELRFAAAIGDPGFDVSTQASVLAVCRMGLKPARSVRTAAGASLALQAAE